ncbi:MAG: hypothetical protein M1837_003838 [Sclerophora amabilis]|nr:MAG: hypothetical protein M1837_003838 [Sclerophora amabilis]
MDGDSHELGNQPAEEVAPILNPEDEQPQIASNSAQDTFADTVDQEGVDISMMETTSNIPQAEIKRSPEDPSNSTPPVVSDNPMDAPEAPRPQDEDDDDKEDEEMGGTNDESKKEKESEVDLDNESPDKDGTDGQGAAFTEDTATESQPVQTKASLESSARSHLIAQTYAIILPSYSTWFDMHMIHTIEKKQLPEFFNNRNRSKTPVVYKDYRDFMINTYRLNPAEYLTVTACRRNLAGDVCAIMRIDPDTRPSNIGPPFTGHFRITADTPRGLQPFQPAPSSVTTPGKPFMGTERAATATPASKADLNLEIRRNIYDQAGRDLSTPEAKSAEKLANGEDSVPNGTGNNDVGSRSKSIEDLVKEPRKQVNCYSCGVDCTRVRYHSAKSAPPGAATNNASAAAKIKYDLCPNCFLEGRFPNSSSAADFVKLEDTSYSSVPDRDAPWTDAELLLLLEGLELFDDNWSSVADHVGTRTREECVLKFLQLEIEDKYLDNEPTVNGTSSSLSILSGGRAPYSQADNPVMSVVGFLASLGDQSVAAAAAGKTVDEMRRSLRDRLEKGVGGNEDGTITTGGTADTDKDKGAEMEKGKGKEAVKDEDDSMEVDNNATQPASEQPQRSRSSAAPTNGDPTSSTSPNALATISLATSAARASALASHEEREMTRLVSSAVNLTLQKFELKLQQFNEMESVLQAERRELERGRQQLFFDRLSFKKRVREVQEGLRLASLRGGEEGARMVGEVLSENGINGGNGGPEKLGFKSVHATGNETTGANVGRDVQMLSAEGAPGFRNYEI